MRISDWSSDVCSSDLEVVLVELLAGLVDGVKSDQRILELGRRLAHDRLAVAIDAIDVVSADILRCIGHRAAGCRAAVDRSEEHTSELQSLMRISYAVFCLKKNTTIDRTRMTCTTH